VNAEPKIRLARVDDEGKVTRLLDEAFASPGRESLLWSLLRNEYPAYDPTLGFVAENAAGELDGALLVHPRSLWIRGIEVPSGVLSPFAVAPRARGNGLGGRLMARAMAACAERFDLVVLLGDPRYFQRFGFHRAFGQSRVRARLSKDLSPLAGDGWRAITGADLGTCRELYESSYAGVSGTERRTLTALDWDSRAPHTHTLVLERERRVRAYARFHIGTAITVAESAARLPRDIQALVGLLARLGLEHAREISEVLAPHAHPLVRSLLRAGAESSTHDMTGAVLAWSPAPRRLLTRVLSGPSSLAAHRAGSWSDVALQLPDGPALIARRRRGPVVQALESAAAAPLRIRAERLPGWLTGLEPLREAIDGAAEEDVLDGAPFRSLEALLPAVESFWSWSPLYDVVGW
jgi:predicted N-acetyltransferase YhbS